MHKNRYGYYYLSHYKGLAQKECNDFLIVTFKDIINKTEAVLLCGKLIFQQNDTMIINFG